MNFKYRINQIKNLQDVLSYINKDYKSEYNIFIGFSFINNELYFYKSFTEFTSIELPSLNINQIRNHFKPVIVLVL